jgi:hypothetical protein
VLQGHPREAASLYEGAARLYGPRTPLGREMREAAEAALLAAARRHR